MSTHTLLTTVDYGKPQSKCYAKASASNAALAFDQQHEQNGVIKTVVPRDYDQSLLILHRQGKKKKEHLYSVFIATCKPEFQPRQQRDSDVSQ